LARKKKQVAIRSSAAEYLTYVATVGEQQDSVEMRYEDENIWLTQKMMSTLYDVSVSAINQHIKKIYDDSELEAESQAICPGNSWTFLTNWISPVARAVPQTPRPEGIRMQAVFPWNGPSNR